MVKNLSCLIGLWAVLSASIAMADDKPKVEFRDGDRIAFVGNEFFERDQERGYIETELTTRFPDKNLTFRNLGYSGDTVRADARNLCAGWANFGPEDQGFARLTDLIKHINPTLVFVAYGMNESFDGAAGVEPFVEGLNRMLDMLGANGARIVLVSPIRHEDLGKPLPDPAEHNKSLALYVAAMENMAQQRGMAFINLFKAMGDNPGTFDGIHLTPAGYWRAATVLEQECGYTPRAIRLEIDAKDGSAKPTGIKISNVKADPQSVQFMGTSQMLPLAAAPNQPADAHHEFPVVLAPGQALTLTIAHLAPGQYTLKGDDQVVTSATSEGWQQGQVIRGPDALQTEQLRRIVVAKNFDFFNFWRPDNDTYIFGYRKHEQGRNAAEIPQFEPLVAAKEAEIAKLRVPVSHTYVIVKAEVK
jgi:lysophospholipase L1-like esterase